MKCLEVTMPDGGRWAVPASIIAKDRATYYANRDLEKGNISKSEWDERYEEEYIYTLEDAFEIPDWAANNMNWVDVKEQATFIGPKQLSDRDYQEGWINGKKKIIDIDIRV